MKKQTKFMMVGTAFVLALGLSSCNGKKAAEEYYSFNIAVTANKVVNPLIQIAQEKGYFEAYRFKPNYTTLEMIGTPEALVAGKLDAALAACEAHDTSKGDWAELYAEILARMSEKD